MSRFPLLCTAALLWLSSVPSSVGATEFTLDDLFDDGVHGLRPSDLDWRPGGHELRYTWDDGEGSALWLFDAAEQKSRKLVAESKLTPEGGEADDLQFSPSGDQMLYGVDGDLWLYDLEKGAVQRLTKSASENEKATFSPDGGSVAFVREDELYLLDLKSGEEKRLTHDGEPDVVFNGITDWVYWEEIWGRNSTGFWWSGDSRRIAFYHIDDREVSIYPLVDVGPVHPEIDHQRYPKAGDDLPKVSIRVLDLSTGEVTTLATHQDPDTYLARVHWHPDHQRLVVERLNREQTQLDLLLCGAVDGQCRNLYTEKHPTWLNLGDEFTFLSDGRFLWSSEKSGWKALYLYGADGKELRRLTPEGWRLTGLDLVDEEGGRFVYSAYSTGELGAAERHVFEGRLDGGEPTRWTTESGWHRGQASDSGYWLHTWSDADTSTSQAVRHRTKEEVGLLPSTPPTFDLASLPKWEHFTIPGPEGSRLPAQMMKPTGFDPEKKYPVVTYHYGGPASQVVDKRWRSGRLRGLWHKYLAHRGYVVFSVDNLGSSYFGKAGEDRMHRRFGEVELEGQLAGVDYLRSLPWVDAERIGLWGWSGGGSNTLYSLFRKPGVWAVGISGAPVTHWHYYDAIWIERYLDHPEDNVAGYRDSSALTHAANLEEPLLLIHGTADNNVHPQNSINLVDRLIEADKRFELALYPGVRHSLETFNEAYQRHLFRTMTEFFDRYLIDLKPEGQP